MLPTPSGRGAMLRSSICGIVLTLAVARSSFASEITAPVEQLHTGLIAIMKAGKAVPFRQRYETIAPVVGRTFDLDAILRLAIGSRWTSLPPDQQAALAEAFKRYTIASYVANFDDYSGQRFEISPAVRAAGDDRVVETTIAGPSGQAHVLAYVMRQEDRGWRIVDVLADGSVSRVATQRSEMRSVLSDGGGSGLVVSLRRKTAELSGGILQ